MSWRNIFSASKLHYSSTENSKISLRQPADGHVILPKICRMIGKFWRNNKKGEGIERFIILWNIVTDFLSEMWKPRIEAHTDISWRLLWRSFAIMWGLDDCWEIAWSSVKRPYVRANIITYLVRSLIPMRKGWILHTSSWWTTFWIGWWEEVWFSI